MSELTAEIYGVIEEIRGVAEEFGIDYARLDQASTYIAAAINAVAAELNHEPPMIIDVLTELLELNVKGWTLTAQDPIGVLADLLREVVKEQQAEGEAAE
jgi:hypothetical protein